MKVLFFFIRLLHSIRYKITLSGQEHLIHEGPILVLPNHVALIDPRIIMSQVGKYRVLSPLASEKYYNIPVLKQIMQFLGTIPIADISVNNAAAGDISQVYKKIQDAFLEGKSVLIYPSGQIYRQGYESIKGKQSVYQVVKNLPSNVKIIGVKDRGLWGSIWSMAWDNGETGFFQAYLKCIYYSFANLLFFVPKRRVTLEVHNITDLVRQHTQIGLHSLNNALEDFYNTEYGASYEEKIQYIPHYFYYNDVKNKKIPERITGSEKEIGGSTDIDTSLFGKESLDDIYAKISEMKGVQQHDLFPGKNLILELYFDSLDMAEIKSYIQAKYIKASNPAITSLKRISDLWATAEGKSQNQESLKSCEWGTPAGSEIYLKELLSQRNTQSDILQLWKKNHSKNWSEAFLWDNTLGLQTRKDIKLKAYVVAEKLKEIPGDKIGIMLPAVGSASLLILASYLAGKTPVMLNWTLGKESFDHCVRVSQVPFILTAKSFYTRVENDFLESYKNNNTFLFAEDLFSKVSLPLKLKALIKSTFLLGARAPETAVILFTSGSESLPKAIALSHQNIIENIAGSLEIFALKNSDKIIGFLPPFHSFGFTVNTIMPLITGLQVAYTPDPNDAKTILEIIKHAHITGVTATPTFLSMILSLASGEDLESLKYAVVGAEKCPEYVFQNFQRLVPQGKILEGYGITECSPVVSINPVENPKAGSVGKIIPNLTLKIIDIDTQKESIIEQQGMIYVSGSSIFSGYLDSELLSPFEDIDGVKYYKTGDLGYIDSQGYLFITGRLKRFVKIAGEMISLPFIEQTLSEKFSIPDMLSFAIEAQEGDGEVKIVAFTLQNSSLEEMNAYLRQRGVANIVKISEIQTISAIPVLGTGKTDYKELKKLIEL